MASWNGPDPKPAKRIKATPTDWEIIRKFFAYSPCAHCGQAYESLHHILPRSQGGSDLVDNLVPLCGDGTRGCHGTLESHAPGWERIAASIRQYVMVSNDRRGYQEDKAGESFNRRYPPLPSTDPQFLADYQTIMSRHSAPIPKGDAK